MAVSAFGCVEWGIGASSVWTWPVDYRMAPPPCRWLGRLWNRRTGMKASVTHTSWRIGLRVCWLILFALFRPPWAAAQDAKEVQVVVTPFIGWTHWDDGT